MLSREGTQRSNITSEAVAKNQAWDHSKIAFWLYKGWELVLELSLYSFPTS